MTFPSPLLRDFTPAERLVAVHLAQGLTTKEISTMLGRAEPTIKRQTCSVLQKTGFPSRSRFIALYYQQYFCVLPLAGISLPKIACALTRGGAKGLKCNDFPSSNASTLL